MDKNSITGIILIFLLMIGFSAYQSKRYNQQLEYQQQLKAEQDSIAAAELGTFVADMGLAEGQEDSPADQSAPASIYKDSLLDVAHNAEESFYTLENDKVEIVFTSKGAQPYKVHIKGYDDYKGNELVLLPEGSSKYAVSVYTGEYISTSDFVFELAGQTANELVFRLPFAGGGYVEQRFTLEEDS